MLYASNPAMAKSPTAPRPAVFIEPMECLPVKSLPEGAEWTYEIKLDGYRMEAVHSGASLTLYSRRENTLNSKFEYIAKALSFLPVGTVIDGELVAMGTDGRPSFNLLQNFRSAQSHIVYYAFDILIHQNRDLTTLPLSERREILRHIIEPSEHVSLSVVGGGSAAEMLHFVRHHQLEGVIAKRSDSVYQPGKRTGLWSKHRISLGQEFVVGGYIPSNLGVDSLVIGFHRDGQLIYAGRVRAGFIPATRRKVFNRISPLKTETCPFANLPEKAAGRWGEGLTAEKTKECVWIQPEIVAQVEFLEWTAADHLRHTSFIGLRDDKDPSKVLKETE